MKVYDIFSIYDNNSNIIITVGSDGDTCVMKIINEIHTKLKRRFINLGNLVEMFYFLIEVNVMQNKILKRTSNASTASDKPCTD